MMNPLEMNAWTLTAHKSPQHAFELRPGIKPEPGLGQVRIKVEMFGLNFADVMARLGLYPDCPPLPAVLGYDVGGEIDALGTGVTGWNIGDRVFGLTRFGGYATYAITDARAIARLPSSLPMEVGVALATQGVTALYMARYVQPLRAGERVLIHAAAGGVGTLMVQLAKAAGCQVFGTAGSPEKLEYLAAQGVDHPIDYRKEDFAKAIDRIGGPLCLDAIFDPVGGSSVKKGMALLRPGGRMLCFGGSSFLDSRGYVAKILNAIRYGFYHPLALTGGSRSLIGVNMLRIADHRPEIIQELMEGCAALASDGVLSPTIFRVFPATQLPEAHELLESRSSTGKLVLTWEK